MTEQLLFYLLPREPLRDRLEPPRATMTAIGAGLTGRDATGRPAPPPRGAARRVRAPARRCAACARHRQRVIGHALDLGHDEAEHAVGKQRGHQLAKPRCPRYRVKDDKRVVMRGKGIAERLALSAHKPEPESKPEPEPMTWRRWLADARDGVTNRRNFRSASTSMPARLPA